MVIVVTMVGPDPGPSRWNDLSRTQKIIAWLVSQALTNQAIARRLYLSPHTVNYHLRQIYQKLGINSRVELARIVQEQTGGRPELPGGNGNFGA
jgi:DNA-binding CsgD family transcriptional regulator